MTSIDEYRVEAEDCLQHALTAADDQDMSLWATLAQSWLRLAEDADRIRSGHQAALNGLSIDIPEPV